MKTDFSDMYTSLGADKVKRLVCQAVDKAYAYEALRFAKDNPDDVQIQPFKMQPMRHSGKYTGADWDFEEGFSAVQVKQLVSELIDSNFIRNGSIIGRQRGGIAIGSESSQPEANIALMEVEWDHMEAILANEEKGQRARQQHGYMNAKRYVDDCVTLESAAWMLPTEEEYGLKYSSKDSAETGIFVGFKYQSLKDRFVVSMGDKQNVIRFPLTRYPQAESTLPRAISIGSIVGCLNYARQMGERDETFIGNAMDLFGIIAQRGTMPAVFVKGVEKYCRSHIGAFSANAAFRSALIAEAEIQFNKANPLGKRWSEYEKSYMRYFKCFRCNAHGHRATECQEPIVSAKILHRGERTPAERMTESGEIANKAIPIVQKTAVSVTASQKNVLGNLLYDFINQRQPEQCSKITGLLLEMDNSQILSMLESPTLLEERISEAIVVLSQVHDVLTTQSVHTVSDSEDEKTRGIDLLQTPVVQVPRSKKSINLSSLLIQNPGFLCYGAACLIPFKVMCSLGEEFYVFDKHGFQSDRANTLKSFVDAADPGKMDLSEMAQKLWPAKFLSQGKTAQQNAPDALGVLLQNLDQDEKRLGSGASLQEMFEREQVHYRVCANCRARIPGDDLEQRVPMMLYNRIKNHKLFAPDKNDLASKFEDMDNEDPRLLNMRCPKGCLVSCGFREFEETTKWPLSLIIEYDRLSTAGRVREFNVSLEPTFTITQTREGVEQHVSYELFATIRWNGSSLNSGHYTNAVKMAGNSWVLIDSGATKTRASSSHIKTGDVMLSQQTTVAYYRRTSVSDERNRATEYRGEKPVQDYVPRKKVLKAGGFFDFFKRFLPQSKKLERSSSRESMSSVISEHSVRDQDCKGCSKSDLLGPLSSSNADDHGRATPNLVDGVMHTDGGKVSSPKPSYADVAGSRPLTGQPFLFFNSCRKMRVFFILTRRKAVAPSCTP